MAEGLSTIVLSHISFTGVAEGLSTIVLSHIFFSRMAEYHGAEPHLLQ
jgi:hypothetical protein